MYSGVSGEMENPLSDKVSVNNPADLSIIVGYFIMVIGVGIWVSAPLLVWIIVINREEILMAE